MMKKYISMIVFGLMMASCMDTVILPDDKTVDEDFWKSKSDVQLMVNGAYQGMLSSDVIKRLIVWGSLRSDELVPVASVSGASAQSVLEDLVEINTGNTQYDNMFATWGAVYTVINRCNLVLDRAKSVVGAYGGNDPSYTEGDYLADCSQMLALRALCYFYLVRNFRDVPYYTEAYMNSSQPLDIAQTAPETVLLACIADLEEAEKNAISPLAYTDWRRVGYFNTEGIDALLADIYLWLGSVKHDNAYYEKAVEYCDKVIASKQQAHALRDRSASATEDEYPLAEGKDMFDELFNTMNAEESIFELQFDGSTNSNVGVCEMLNRYSSSAANSYLHAPTIFVKGGNVYNTAGDDWRAVLNTYKSDGGSDVVVRKMVYSGQTPNSMTASSDQEKAPSTLRAYAKYRQNYIIYRLTDVMLMKAEALMALATGDDDETHLHAAFDLIRAVNLRAKSNASDALTWSTSYGQSQIEALVLAERLRELAFEGKRWYDLLRYNYRHAEDGTVYYSLTMAEQNERGIAFASTLKEMLALMARKLGAQGDAVSAKLGTEPTLYMPVPKADLEVSPQLRQNPAYSVGTEYEKNY